MSGPTHFKRKLAPGLGHGGHQTDARLVRVGAAWQAATYLPPAHINAHERAAPPVIRTSNGRRPSLSGKRGRVVVHTAPRHPAASSKPDSGDHVPNPSLDLAGRPPAAMGLWNYGRKGKHDREAGSSSGHRRGSSGPDSIGARGRCFFILVLC